MQPGGFCWSGRLLVGFVWGLETYDACAIWLHVYFVDGSEEDEEVFNYEPALFGHHATDGVCVGLGAGF